MRLLVVDCDTGVDDSHALLIALSQQSSSCKLLAITCVGGNCGIDKVLRNTLYVLDLCGHQNIPIYRGASSGLLYAQKPRTGVHGVEGLGGVENLPQLNSDRVQQEPAAAALVDLVKKHPDQLTLVSLGPMTNLALAQRLYPEFSSKLKELIIMGGSTTSEGNMPVNAEFNVERDPESAHIVLSEFTCVKKLVPWDMCLTHTVPWNFYEKVSNLDTEKARFFRTATMEFVKRMRERLGNYQFITGRMGNLNGFVSYDGLAMVVALMPACVKESTVKSVMVETGGSFSRGHTVVDWRNFLGRTPDVEIITKLDMDVVMNMFEEAIY